MVEDKNIAKILTTFWMILYNYVILILVKKLTKKRCRGVNLGIPLNLNKFIYEA